MNFKKGHHIRKAAFFFLGERGDQGGKNQEVESTFQKRETQDLPECILFCFLSCKKQRRITN